MNSGCDKFHPASRSYKLCCESNSFREMHGLGRIEGLSNRTLAIVPAPAVTRSTRPPEVIVRPSSAQTSRGCGSCGSSTPRTSTIKSVKTPSRPDAEAGPGTRLKNLFAATGAPICEACERLANQMDAWGVQGCFHHLEDIVADIMPRALEWEGEKFGWFANLVPDSVTTVAIRQLVLRAIHLPVKRKRVQKKHTLATPQNSSTLPPLIGQPIDRDKLVSHMLYHVMPLAGEAEPIWLRHMEWIREVRSRFNGRLLVGINTASGTDKPGHVFMPPDAVKEALHGLDAEYFLAKNDKKLGEGMTFPKMLAEIKTSNPDEVFFYGHTKGVTRSHLPLDQPPHLWASAMFETLFRNPTAAIAALDHSAITGPFRMPGGLPVDRPGVGPWWFFSGTFFAARSVDVFRRNWQKLPRHYGCVEQWPRLMFKRESESTCLFGDNINNLYEGDYWGREITPALHKWTSARHPLTVSVAIICHDYGRYLRECLASVRHQSLPASEIFVVNDSSTDDTIQRCEKLGVPVISVNHHHVHHARRTALERSTGDAILFLDADDKLPFAYLEDCARMLRDPSIGIAYSDYEVFGDSSGRSHFPDDATGIQNENCIHSGALVRTQALRDADAFSGPLPPQNIADWHLWKCVLSHGWKAKKQRVSHYGYRHHCANMQLGQPEHHRLRGRTFGDDNPDKDAPHSRLEFVS